MKKPLASKEMQSWFTYKRLFRYVRHYWFVFIIALVGSIGYSAIDAALIKFLQPLIDDGLVDRDAWFIQLIPIVLPLAFLFRGVMSFTSDYSMAWLTRKVITEIRMQIFNHLQHLPATFYDNNASGKLLSMLIYNTDQIARAATDVIIDSTRNVFLVIFLIGVMFWTNWQLTLTFLVVAPPVILIFVFASRRFRKLSRQAQEAMGDMTHVAEENMENYKVVRIFGGEKYETQQFDKAVERTRRYELKNYFTRSISVPGIQVLGGFALGLTIYVAMNYLPASEVTAGSFATLAAAMIGLLKPLKEISNISNKIQRGLAGAETIFALLDEPTEQDHGNYVVDRVKGDVKFDHVSFTYQSSSVPVLDNITFEVKPGQRIALLGRSGAGKSTIINLLTGFYTNYQGIISIDGHSLREFNLATLRKQFAVVSQHITLFNDTIANNITYGGDIIDQRRLYDAARAAHALEFIEMLPDGFSSMVGENGVLLSGGQRQRLAIARAIYKDAPILILDEATSALDTESERHIQLAMNELMLNRTSLIIAHRLSTVEQSDQILVLDGGQIVEQGTHQQLLEMNGHYARFRKMQML
ncbi:MAG: lipid A export permease/ATP-binding protein MsbA [Gammaproteobacteria bacterium]